MDFRLIRKLNKITILDESHKNLIRSYDKEKEKEMNSLILGKLAEEMIAGNVLPDYKRGFHAALMWRISFLGQSNYKFPINKPK